MPKMRRNMLILVAVLTGVGAAAVAQAGSIVGSKHDLSAMGALDGQICIACHTPHNADVTAVDAPLWNHTLTTATYTLYDSPTFTGKPSQTTPGGVSKLCLSCHDGTVALDAFGGRPGSTMIGGSGDLTTNLKKSHPVSFTYDSTLATDDGELADPSTLPAGWLNGGKFECSSCHDVHNKLDTGKMLLKSNANSALCLTCHVK
jgi:predicted CXXCH cytochrome family protein